MRQLWPGQCAKWWDSGTVTSEPLLLELEIRAPKYECKLNFSLTLPFTKFMINAKELKTLVG
jgi:hypothetical protein